MTPQTPAKPDPGASSPAPWTPARDYWTHRWALFRHPQPGISEFMSDRRGRMRTWASESEALQAAARLGHATPPTRSAPTLPATPEQDTTS